MNRHPRTGDDADGSDPAIQASDIRLLSSIRCLFAVCGLLIIWLVPSEPKRLVELTYLSLWLYLGYSAAVLVLAAKRLAAPMRRLHWLDVLFAAFITALTDGTNSVFFWFFLFAVLAASWLHGLREGVRVTLASVLLFVLAGAVAAPFADPVELDRAIIRPVFLMLVGYLVAVKGGSDIEHMRRLALLGELSVSFNPRHRAGSYVQALDRLRRHLGASDCLLVLEHDAPARAAMLYRAAPGAVVADGAATDVSDAVATQLLSLQDAHCFHPAPERHRGLLRWSSLRRAGAVGASATAEVRERCGRLAELLECGSLLSVPFSVGDGSRGRVYALWTGRRRIAAGDLDFLHQWSVTLAMLSGKARLVDELVARAAADERDDLSRDLHDTAIQPYVGLKLALEALLRDRSDAAGLERRVGEVLQMTNATLGELRSYVTDIRAGRPVLGHELVQSVERHAQRLARFYDLQVRVDASGLRGIDPAVATAAHRIVIEGLNNVLRHTDAREATVTLGAGPGMLSVGIANPVGSMPPAPFLPRSIHERARQIGGTLQVDRDPQGDTRIVATLPLRKVLSAAA